MAPGSHSFPCCHRCSRCSRGAERAKLATVLRTRCRDSATSSARRHASRPPPLTLAATRRSGQPHCHCESSAKRDIRNKQRVGFCWAMMQISFQLKFSLSRMSSATRRVSKFQTCALNPAEEPETKPKTFAQRSQTRQRPFKVVYPCTALCSDISAPDAPPLGPFSGGQTTTLALQAARRPWTSCADLIDHCNTLDINYGYGACSGAPLLGSLAQRCPAVHAPRVPGHRSPDRGPGRGKATGASAGP